MTLKTSKGYGNVVYLDAPYSIKVCRLEWQKMGLQQTASGYGNKLATEYILTASDGKHRRVYAICYSNCASFYVRVGNDRLFLRDHELQDARDAKVQQ